MKNGVLSVKDGQKVMGLVLFLNLLVASESCRKREPKLRPLRVSCAHMQEQQCVGQGCFQQVGCQQVDPG